MSRVSPWTRNLPGSVDGLLTGSRNSRSDPNVVIRAIPKLQLLAHPIAARISSAEPFQKQWLKAVVQNATRSEPL